MISETPPEMQSFYTPIDYDRSINIGEIELFEDESDMMWMSNNNFLFDDLFWTFRFPS